jgi:hypothetical protein
MEASEAHAHAFEKHSIKNRRWSGSRRRGEGFKSAEITLRHGNFPHFCIPRAMKEFSLRREKLCQAGEAKKLEITRNSGTCRTGKKSSSSSVRRVITSNCFALCRGETASQRRKKNSNELTNSFSGGGEAKFLGFYDSSSLDSHRGIMQIQFSQKLSALFLENDVVEREREGNEMAFSWTET